MNPSSYLLNLLNREQLNCGGELIHDLIRASPESANLKEAQTGKYIQTNLHFAASLGFQATDDLIGLTIDDLLTKHKIWKREASPVFLNWKNRQAAVHKRLEYRAQITQSYVSIPSIFFTHEGFIRLQSVGKKPIFGHDNNKIVALLGVIDDRTLQYSLLDLFQLYRKYYPTHIAIALMLQYLHLERYFISLPTVKEMQVLLTMYCHHTRKHIAQQLNISSNTVTAHIRHLKNKLTVPDYSRLLIQLRAAKEHDEVTRQ